MKPDQRMRLDSLAMVNRIAEARDKLLRQIAVIERPEPEELIGTSMPLTITIAGERMGATMRALVRPVVVTELRAQVASLTRDLEALGVSVQPSQGSA